LSVYGRLNQVKYGKFTLDHVMLRQVRLS